MPIHRTLNLRSVSDTEFELINKAVMRCAYASQNKFGRLFDERIYENDVAARLKAEGFVVHTQVPVKVMFGDFGKSYYLDLVVNEMLYELKVVSALVKEHEAQGLNYAMLQDIRRVKLINFGAEMVQGKLLRNAVTEAERHQPTMRNSGFELLGAHCARLIEYLKLLIRDWGTHLDSRLYSEGPWYIIVVASCSACIDWRLFLAISSWVPIRFDFTALVMLSLLRHFTSTNRLIDAIYRLIDAI